MAVNRYDQDEETVEKVNLKCFSKMLKYLKPHIPALIISTLTMFLASFLELLPPYFTSIVLDKCLPDRNYKQLAIIGIILIVSAFVVLICTRIRSYYTNKSAMDIISSVRSDLFAHLQELPFSFFDSRPHGKILVRVVNYINSIANLFANGIINMLVNLFKMIVILGFMIVMDIKFTLICLIGMPIFLLILTLIRKKHRKIWQKLSAKQSNLNAYLQESIAGMKITQSFAREKTNAKIFDGLCEDNKKFWMKARYIEMSIGRIVGLLMETTVVLVYIIGLGRMESGTVQVGLLIAFASYVKSFWQPVNELSSFYNELINCGTYIERIFEMMEEPVVVTDTADAIALPPIKGNVKFDNVTFAYEKNAPDILKDVSFEVNHGESVALVGPTGAGKSTIINLLARFYNLKGGKITIDGYDTANVTLKSLRSQMGIMLQDSFLFSGTIMDNIRYSKLDATDDEVIEAAKAVCAHDFIIQFPDGYNTEINEDGSGLSAGQRQLIAFARTLLANPAILILDEATSSIDTETEIALQKGLERLLVGRTSFIIAHRLSTIKNSSKIMYICNKNIAESGSHDELMELKGNYYNLYMAQYKFLEQL